MFKQQAEREVKFKDLKTVKIKKDPYELEKPDFYNNPKAAARYKELCKEFRETYVPPKDKVCRNFTQYFKQYAWPIPNLVSKEEGIRVFCPFEPTGEYIVKQGFKYNPTSEIALTNMLHYIKLCPCEKPECKARLLMLSRLHRQRELVKEFSEKLINEVLFQPLSNIQE